MLNGTRRSQGSGDYVFVNGKAVRADEVVRIQVDSKTSVPGEEQAAKQVPGQQSAPKPADAARAKAKSGEKLPQAPSVANRFMLDDRRTTRRKYAIFGIVLLALICVSLCISHSYYWTFNSPLEVLSCYGAGLKVLFAHIFNSSAVEGMQMAIVQEHPAYYDIIAQLLAVFRYFVCGVILAVSGMLYQNVFRNPIAGPSMLGVSNGMSMALLVLVMIYGTEATAMKGSYYLFSYIGGAVILILVMLGGKYMSGKGKGRFNVVNMLLAGTIISQLLGVIMLYIQNSYMTELNWQTYYTLQTATDIESAYTYISLAIGGVAAIIPIFLMRFRLNMVSFDDLETRLLGVNPNALRIIALTCGSAMIITAQVNAGQIAMASLVIPFLVRAAFGSEFRRQLIGNIICGAAIMLIGGDLVTYIHFDQFEIDLGSVITVCALPLFVWMIGKNQRGWE